MLWFICCIVDNDPECRVDSLLVNLAINKTGKTIVITGILSLYDILECDIEKRNPETTKQTEKKNLKKHLGQQSLIYF